MTSFIKNTKILNYGRMSFVTIMLLLISTATVQTSCKSAMAFFDATSLSNMKNLKLDAVKLMGLATGQYSANEAAVTALTGKLNDQLDYEKGRGDNNKKTVEMLSLLMNPDKNLLGGFLKRWKSAGSLSSAFVNEAKNQVSSNFDKIINLENNKRKK